MTFSGLVTVSLVTYEGRRWIEGCIASVLAQTHRPIELFVIDNASKDGTAECAQELLANHDLSRVIQLHSNVGYAAGHNLGIELSTGEAICLLNQDVELEPSFLERALGALEFRPDVGAVQGHILGMDQHGRRTSTLDTTGIEVFRSRRMLSRGQGQSSSLAHFPRGPVFGADGPAPVYRTAALRSVRVRTGAGRSEVLDEDFFLYHEDTDLAWRLRIAGWDTLYEPDAIAWHARGLPGPRSLSPATLARERGGADPEKARLAWRNQRLMVLKNESRDTFSRDFLWIGAREAGSFLLLLRFGPKRIVALRSLIAMLPSTIRKRRQVQRMRRRRDPTIGHWFRGSQRGPR